MHNDHQLDPVSQGRLATTSSKLTDLIERTFQREGSPNVACNDRHFFTSEKPKTYHAWSCQNVCDALTFLMDNILFDLAPSCIDK